MPHNQSSDRAQHRDCSSSTKRLPPQTMVIGKILMFTLLDLSAAFDSVGHKVVLTHQCDLAGVLGPALQWLQLFLSSRTQRVVMGKCSSSWRASPTKIHTIPASLQCLFQTTSRESEMPGCWK